MNRERLTKIVDNALAGKNIIVITTLEEEYLTERFLVEFAQLDYKSDGSYTDDEMNQLESSSVALARLGISIISISESDTVHSIINKFGNNYDKVFVIK